MYNGWHHDRRWLPSFWKISYLGKGNCVIGKFDDITFLQPLVVLNGIVKVPIVLCHYPLAQWDRKHYGSWHLHGHSHGTYKTGGKIMDIGVDCNDFYPFSIEQISSAMESRGLVQA